MAWLSLPKKPKQSFLNKVVDQFSANTEADKYRRASADYQRKLSGSTAPKSTAIAKPLVEGWKRSIAGLGETGSGFVDAITPGKGTSQITKNFRTSGELSDIEARNKNYNTGLYKAGQLGGEGAQVLATAGLGTLAKGTQYGAKTASVASKVLPKITKPGVVGNTARFLTKPAVMSNVVSNTAQGTGFRTSRGIENTPGAVALDAGISLGIGAAPPIIGAGVRKVGGETAEQIAKKTNPGRDELRRTLKQAQKAFDVETDPIRRKEINRYIADLNKDLRRTGNIIPTARADDGFRVTPPKDPLEPIVDKPKVSIKQANVDPTDPFGNRGLIKKIRNEAGSLIDDDAQMITLLRKIEKDTGQKGLVDQWYFDTGNIKSSNSIANAKLRQSDDLKDAFGGLTKSGVKDYDTYAGARAELKNYEGLPTSKSKADLEQIVASGDAEFGARFNSQANYYKKMAQDAYDGGLISKEKLDDYLSTDDYIRVQRDMDDLLPSNFGSSQSRSLGSTKATQKRTGSKRDILSPSETTAKRTQEIQLEIQRNKAASNTIDVLQEQGLATKVPEAKNKNVIKRMVDGKVEYYEVHPDIKKVMDNVNPFQLGVLAKIVSFPVRVLRAGATALSAPFTVTNYLRDQASSALVSKSVLNTHNPQNIVRGLASATRDAFGESQHPLWKKFEMYAGDQTIFDELRNAKNTTNVLREIRRGQSGKAYNAVKAPIRTLEDLNSITEKATRFQNFKGIYEKSLKATGNEDEAIKAAVLAARRNSVDFQRSSDFTRTLNLFIPYFNAGVQGSRTVARSFKERPVATSMKSVGFVAIPSVAVTMYNYSDAERRKVYESIDEYEKEDNYIVVGRNPKQQPDGSWTGVYKIPKPQGYRELTDPVRDMAESFASGELVEDVAGMFYDMLGGLTGTTDISSPRGFAGSLVPQQVKPAVQAYANTDLYSGNKIVPEFMEAATDDPTKQAYENTSGMARMIAEQIGVSPIKVEKFFADTAGSLGRLGVNTVDNALNKAGKIPEEQIGGRSVKEDFSRRLFEASADVLEENKSAGRKYYEAVDRAKEGAGFNQVEEDAYNTLHPSKTDFLGQELFDENKRVSKYIKAGIYLQHPKTYEVDKAVDAEQRKQGQPGNPLFDLKGTQLNKVLLKQALPPGASDPELDALWKEEWYQDYKNNTTKFYDSLKAKMAKEGKTLPNDSTYPVTSTNLQATMDAYSALPKGTGARSSWIEANPKAWSEMTNHWQAIDNWENKERGTIGLNPLTDEEGNDLYGSGNSFGYGNGSSKDKTPTAAYTKPTEAQALKKVSLKSSSPEIRTKKSVKRRARPKIQLKKSNV